MIADIQSTAEMAKMAELLKYSTIVVSSIPLLVMYPFFKKYFDKGVICLLYTSIGQREILQLSMETANNRIEINKIN